MLAPEIVVLVRVVEGQCKKLFKSVKRQRQFLKHSKDLIKLHKLSTMDFTKFDEEISRLETKHFGELYKPLPEFYTIIIDKNENCQIVWKDKSCPKLIRDEVIAAASFLS